MKNKFLLAGALLFTLLLASCAAVFEDTLPVETPPTGNGSTTEAIGTSTLPVDGTTTSADAAETSVLTNGTTTAPVETEAPVPALDPANGAEQPLPETETQKAPVEETQPVEPAPGA